VLYKAAAKSRVVASQAHTCLYPQAHLQGSMAMSYDASNLTTPDIKWLGVRPSDLDRFNIPQQCRYTSQPPVTALTLLPASMCTAAGLADHAGPCPCMYLSVQAAHD
jgi:hypothetical protein